MLVYAVAVVCIYMNDKATPSKASLQEIQTFEEDFMLDVKCLSLIDLGYQGRSVLGSARQRATCFILNISLAAACAAYVILLIIFQNCPFYKYILLYTILLH